GHYTTAAQITPANVSNLEVAWTHRSGDFTLGGQSLTDLSDLRTRPSSFTGTPIMVVDTLYYCTPFNRVFALDPTTGAEKWVFDPEVNMVDENITNCRAVSSWRDTRTHDTGNRPNSDQGVCQHRIILGTLDARLISLDAQTGKRCTEFGDNGEVSLTIGLTEHENSEYSITSAPAIIGDIVITGAFVQDSKRPDTPSGVVRAYDVRTGKFLWGWNPVHPSRPQIDEDGNYVPGSTNVWSTISVDEALGLVIVPTGNSAPDYYGGDRQGHLDYYSSSVVALNATDGTVAWHFQTVHHDIWDYDVPAQPTLVDLTINGKTRPAVVQVTKMGLTFVLDRETGKPLHPVEERAVPQDGAVPGEYLSPTQPFPVKPAPLHKLGLTADDAWGFTFWDKAACRDKLANMNTGPIYTPPSLAGTALYPSNLGGNNWGAPAIDLVRKIMIVNTKHLPIEVRLAKQKDCPADLPFPQHGSDYCVIMAPIVSPLGAPCTAPPWATLAAVDLESGEILWQIPLGSLENLAPWPIYHFIEGGIEMGGPMVTASGLAFIAATSDAYIRAFDTLSGEELWKAQLPTTGNAVPMSYEYDGTQYVVIAAGGHFTSPMPAADYVIAYKLPLR
ncbi:MAG: pyrroloquinoline quinone-dependent dehydrogenase, partial [Gammaproteobacteria bacterium]|nr:pyrroloquinoline quinone-dependent dehydrogenase [Gammaproteobacteria bacterium]